MAEEDDIPQEEYIPQGARERRMVQARRKSGSRRRLLGPDARRAVSLERKPVHQEKSEVRRQIERGLNGDGGGGAIALSICFLARQCSKAQLAVAREMLYGLERQGLVQSGRTASAVVQMACHHAAFVRKPKEFRPVDGNEERMVRDLAAHLFARWPVPHWLAGCWLEGQPHKHAWYVHLGAGKNLADAPDLPFPLTRKAAHFAIEAPARLHCYQALRYGQCRALQIPEELCEELVYTRLSTGLPDEPFWQQVLAWFAVNPELLGHAGTIVDYLFAQRIGDFARPPQPDFDIRRRAPDRLLADARAWHETLRRRPSRAVPGVPLHWPPSGIGPFPTPAPALAPPPEADVATPPSPACVIVELCSIAELEAEGAALHHCVASYAGQCAVGHSAIFSLRRETLGVLRPRVTIEVWPAQRTIAQARGLQNCEPDAADRKTIEFWAAAQGLLIASHVFDLRTRVRGRDRVRRA